MVVLGAQVVRFDLVPLEDGVCSCVRGLQGTSHCKNGNERKVLNGILLIADQTNDWHSWLTKRRASDIFTSTFSVFTAARLELAGRFGVKKGSEATSSDQSALFMCDMVAALLATTLSSPFNYARNLIYAHPEGLIPRTTRGELCCRQIN